MILISFCTQGKGGSEALRPESGGTSSSDPEAHILDATSCHTEFSFQSKAEMAPTLRSPQKEQGRPKGRAAQCTCQPTRNNAAIPQALRGLSTEKNLAMQTTRASFPAHQPTYPIIMKSPLLTVAGSMQMFMKSSVL